MTHTNYDLPADNQKLPRMPQGTTLNVDEVRQLRVDAPIRSVGTIITTGLAEFFADPDRQWSAPIGSTIHTETADQLLRYINAEIDRENEFIAWYNHDNFMLDIDPDGKDKTSRSARRIEQTRSIDYLDTIKSLSPILVAGAIRRTHHVITICPSRTSTNPDTDILAVYDDRPDSDTYGTYRTDLTLLRRICRLFNPDLNKRDIEEVLTILADGAPRHPRATNRDLVAVNNGIFDFSTKTLHDFDPAHIFLTKSPVDYDPNATNPVITHPVDKSQWDIESWIADLSDDEGIPELLWEIASAVLRPYVSWNKSAWLFSEVGNNGKGTFLALLRNLTGEGNYASIPLSDFSRDFLLEPLTNASAILVDENDVGTYLDKTANMKAVITNDVISINRKYRAPINYQFFGFMVQCLNDKPAIRDKSESFFRRQCFVPFNKSFTGAERRYIKDDYIARDDVLRYALHRVLHMNHYTLSEPAAAREALDEYRLDVDPVRAFWDEFCDEFAWDLVPYAFCYDLYSAWNARANPNSKTLSQRKFTAELKALVARDDSNWQPVDNQRPGTLMTNPEPLSATFGLDTWINSAATPGQTAYTVPKNLRAMYRGLRRITPASTTSTDTEKDT